MWEFMVCDTGQLLINADDDKTSSDKKEVFSQAMMLTFKELLHYLTDLRITLR
jgi:hypothetical protein